MTREEQKRVDDLAVKTMKENRSVDRILETLRNAGIIDKAGKVRFPYNKVVVKR